MNFNFFVLISNSSSQKTFPSLNRGCSHLKSLLFSPGSWCHEINVHMITAGFQLSAPIKAKLLSFNLRDGHEGRERERRKSFEFIFQLLQQFYLFLNLLQKCSLWMSLDIEFGVLWQLEGVMNCWQKQLIKRVPAMTRFIEVRSLGHISWETWLSSSLFFFLL